MAKQSNHGHALLCMVKTTNLACISPDSYAKRRRQYRLFSDGALLSKVTHYDKVGKSYPENWKLVSGKFDMIVLEAELTAKGFQTDVSTDAFYARTAHHS
jgi:hypothetical protein